MVKFLRTVPKLTASFANAEFYMQVPGRAIVRLPAISQ
jgi:hypothetical protein